MKHDFEPTEGYIEDCVECCQPEMYHRVSEEHERQVILMMNGAWYNSIFAAWPKGDDGPRGES